MKLLLEYGAKTNAKDIKGLTPLHLACRENATDCVKLLLENGALIEAKEDRGLTPLHYTCHKNAADCVRMLFEYGACTGVKTNAGCTPLFYASINCAKDCVKLLLDYSASTEARNLHVGGIRLHYSIANSSESLPDREDIGNALLLSLKLGSSPHATNSKGHTPLQWLLMHPERLIEGIPHLLRCGADPTLPIPIEEDSAIPGEERTSRFKAMDRNEDYLNHPTWQSNSKTKTMSALYYEILRDMYPEVTIDADGVVCWDAREHLEDPTCGTCWHLPGYSPGFRIS